MTRFANLAAAGEQLANALANDEWREPIVLAAMPNGVPVALPVARALNTSVAPMPIERTDDGPVIGELPVVRGRTVLVIDDGVETGSVARAAAAALRAADVGELVLAVPVCSREAMATLQFAYDRIVAVDIPLGRRDLRWHFDDFDNISEATALALLADQNSD